jgi:hypothetical protein
VILLLERSGDKKPQLQEGKLSCRKENPAEQQEDSPAGESEVQMQQGKARLWELKIGRWKEGPVEGMGT